MVADQVSAPGDEDLFDGPVKRQMVALMAQLVDRLVRDNTVERELSASGS